jgi:GT2 family glycosyltransferase
MVDGVDARLARTYVRLALRAPAAPTPQFVRIVLHHRSQPGVTRNDVRGLLLGTNGRGQWIGWLPDGIEAISLDASVVGDAGVTIQLQRLSVLGLYARLVLAQPLRLLRIAPLVLTGQWKGTAIRFTRLVERLAAPAYRDWLAAVDAEDQDRIPLRSGHRVIARISAGSADRIAATVATLQAQSVDVTILTPGAAEPPAEAGDLVLSVPAGTRLVKGACAALLEPFLANPKTRLAYADYDHVNSAGERSVPVLQSAWSARLWQAGGLDCALALMRREDWTDGTVDPGEIAVAAPRGTVAHIPRILSHRPWPAGRFPVRRVVRPQPEPLPPVSVLIPTRDRLSLLARCVEGVLAGTKAGSLEVLILDNDSVEPETMAAFARWRQDPRVRIERVSGPFNYARMMNIGMRIARHERVVQLNNDIEVIDPDWLGVVLAELDDIEVGVVGARLLHPNGRLQHGGVMLGAGTVAQHAHTFIDPASGEDGGANARCRDVSAVTGACLATRRSTWNAVGGMDETNLMVAFNDVDYCLKVRAHGMRVIYQPAATLIHRESVSRGPDATPAQIARFQHEAATMAMRWGEELMADPFFNPQRSLSGDGDDLAVPPRSRQPRWT